MSDRLRELRALCTEKQARLAEAFLENGGNGTEAARAAGYKGGDAALRVTATRTLANANVLAYVEALRDRQGPPGPVGAVRRPAATTTRASRG